MNVNRASRYLWRLAWCGLVGGWLIGGCQDPVYRAKQDARDQRIRDLLEVYAAREEGRPANIRSLTELAEVQRQTHSQQLDATFGLIREASAEDLRDWPARAPVRRQWVQSIFAGRPPGDS